MNETEQKKGARLKLYRAICKISFQQKKQPTFNLSIKNEDIFAVKHTDALFHIFSFCCESVKTVLRASNVSICCYFKQSKPDTPQS